MKRALRTHLPLLAIVALGSSLRMYQIGSKGLWIDEAFSVWLARRPWGEMLRWVGSVDQHPPLYYALLHGWVRVFGDGEASVRSLSAFLGTLTIPVMYVLGRRLFDDRVGLVSALILATSPFHIRFAREARMYALLTLSGALALYAFVRLLQIDDGHGESRRRPRRLGDVRSDRTESSRQIRNPLACLKALHPRSPAAPTDGSRIHLSRGIGDGHGAWGTGALAWLGYVTFTVTMLWTHNAAVLFPVTVNLLVLGRSLIQRRSRLFGTRPKPSFPLSRPWLLAQVAVLLLWLPWVPAFISQAIGVYRRFWLPETTFGTVLGVVSAFLCEFPSLSLPATVALDVVLVAMAMLSLTRERDRPGQTALLGMLFVTPLLVVWFVSLFRPILCARTLIWTSVPLLLMLAAGLRATELRLPSRAGFVVILVLLMAVNGLALHSYYEDVEKEAWDEAAGLVARQVQPDDVLLFNDAWGQIPFDYYFRRLYNGSTAEHGLPVDLFDRGVLEPKMTEDDLPRVEALIRGRERVWLIYSHDWYTDPQGLVPQALEERLCVVDRWKLYGLQVLLYGQGEGCSNDWGY
jgi:hypothetical protein